MNVHDEAAGQSGQSLDTVQRVASEKERELTPLVFLRAILRDIPILFALTFVVLLIVSAVAAEIVAPHDPLQQDLNLRNKPPMTPGTGENAVPHILGTDPLGRDVLSRIIYGARVSLLVGFSSVIASGFFGVLIGLISGYYRGRLDSVVMRIVDVGLGFPTLLAAMFILFTIGPGFWNVVIVLALVRWMVYARVTRGLALSYREMPFVEGARTVGCSDARIIFKHIMPNLISPVLILATLEISSIILAEASLSFLGFGVLPPTPSWGAEVSSGRQYVGSAWWLVTFPGLVIFLTTLSINLLAGWMRAISDPVQRWRWLVGPPKRKRNVFEAAKK